MQRIALIVLACSGMAPLGCATFPPAFAPGSVPAGPSYATGSAVQNYPQGMGTVQPAVYAALDDLHIQSVRQRRDAGAYLFEALTEDGRRVFVTLRPNRGATRMTVRIGWFGDEPLSRALLDRVNIRLGGLPPAAVPAEIPSAPAENPFFSQSAVPDADMFRDQAESRYRDATHPD